MNLVKVKTNQLKDIIKVAIDSDTPLLLFGKPGIGKTMIVEETAKELGYNIINFKLQGLKPYHLTGIQMPDKNREKAIFLRPDFIDKANETPTVIFLDEINRAYQEVINVILEMIREKRIGPHKLRKETRFVLAGNLGEEDNTIVNDLDLALITRGIAVEVIEDLNSWITDFALKHNIDPRIIGFLRYKPELFYKPIHEDEVIIPTPRGWELVSNVLKSIDKLFDKENEELINNIIAGIIGIESTIYFLKFLKTKVNIKIDELFNKIIDPIKLAEWEIHEILYSAQNYIINNKIKPKNMNILYKNLTEQLKINKELLVVFIQELTNIDENYIELIDNSKFKETFEILV